MWKKSWTSLCHRRRGHHSTRAGAESHRGENPGLVPVVIQRPGQVAHAVQNTVEIDTFSASTERWTSQSYNSGRCPRSKRSRGAGRCNRCSHTDVVVDMLMVFPRQVPMEQKIRKSIEAPHIQFSDRVVDVSVVAQRQVPTIQRVQRTIDVRQMQFSDKDVSSPWSCRDKWAPPLTCRDTVPPIKPHRGRSKYRRCSSSTIQCASLRTWKARVPPTHGAQNTVEARHVQSLGKNGGRSRGHARTGVRLTGCPTDNGGSADSVH